MELQTSLSVIFIASGEYKYKSLTVSQLTYMVYQEQRDKCHILSEFDVHRLRETQGWA